MVEPVIAEVIEPRVAVCTVIAEDDAAVTTPVTSSRKSSCPADRVDDAGGSVMALMTLAAVRLTPVTPWVPEFIVRAGPMLIRMRTPACSLEANVSVKPEVVGVAGPLVICATLPVLQPGVPLVAAQEVTTELVMPSLI